MKTLTKRLVLAWSLVVASLLVLVALVWLCVQHRPPMDGQVPPPDAFFEAPPPPPLPAPLKPEWLILLVFLFFFLVNMSVYAIFYVRKWQKLSVLPQSREGRPEDAKEVIFKTEHKTVSVPLDKLRYVESMSEYVKLHLEGQQTPLVVLYRLKQLEKELPASRFMRIHRSYLIALDRIREVSSSSVVLDGGVTLPVSESYRSALRRYLETK